MKTVERDATERAKERKERKEIAEGMKNQGNKAFRAGDYNKALNYFNKAIEQVKDSSLLYTNRALTFINLGLYFRALSDCDTALKIYEKSFKAKLYKAQCLAMLSATDEAESIINDLIHDHPEQKDIIEGEDNFFIWRLIIESFLSITVHY
ncbi:hypothetical protein AAG570_003638 [Ranatra chinensis]|uniref:Uncharacterized protein n=1 Tax=Ranatra chinensis TaxID=642074 RepID=A0ABD0YM96_9HEMI